jgi:hypothetical protein
LVVFATLFAYVLFSEASQPKAWVPKMIYAVNLERSALQTSAALLVASLWGFTSGKKSIGQPDPYRLRELGVT